MKENPRFLKHKPEEILNDWDRKILLEGGAGVVKKILEQVGMPDVIILPETSARPLFYLFDPVFKKVAELKKEKSPRYIFFNVSGPDGYTNAVELSKVGWDYDQAHTVTATIEEALVAVDKGRGSDPLYLQKITRVQDVPVKRFAEKLRAKEMLGNIKKEFGEQSKIITIDDFALERKTESEINRAFNNVVPYYTIFTDDKYSVLPNDKAGMVLTEDVGPNPIANGGDGGLRFSWGNVKKDAIGVKKNPGEKYAIPYNKLKFYDITQEDKNNIEKLRKEMSAIGKEIAKTIH